jgi:hypothetical protein
MLNVNGRSVYIKYRLTVYIYIHEVVNQKIQMKATVSITRKEGEKSNCTNITSGRRRKKIKPRTPKKSGDGFCYRGRPERGRTHARFI